MDSFSDTKEIDADTITTLSEPEGVDDVLETFAKFFGVSKEAVEEKSRRKEIVGIRMMIMYLLREYGGMSFPAIGRLIGNRDHTTVIHAYNKTKNEVSENPSIIESLAAPIAFAEAFKLRKLNIEEELKQMNSKLYAEAVANINAKNISRRLPTVRKIPERNTKILEMHREGLTLQNMAKLFGISRERVRQIVISTIQTLAINESVTKGIVMDINVLKEEELKKRKIAQDLKKPTQPTRTKENRWSRYYDACKSCNSIVYKHVKRGLCERCVGSFRGKVREDILAQHSNQCDVCAMTQPEAIGTYGRDLYITKNKTVLCKKCFLDKSGRKLGSYKNYEWSRFHSACKKCGTTTVPHSGRGLCQDCDNTLTGNQREKVITDRGSKCTHCGRSRTNARKEFNTDFRVTAIKETLCMDCFQKYIRGKRA